MSVYNKDRNDLRSGLEAEGKNEKQAKTNADRKHDGRGIRMEDERGTITRRMDAVLDGLLTEVGVGCTREELERKLLAVKRAGNRSDRPSRLRELFALFERNGILYERGKENAYYETLIREAKLPDADELEDRMLYALYSKFSEYPTPEKYMERLVDRMDPDVGRKEKQTLRLRILKRFVLYGDYLADAGYGGRKYIQDFVKTKTGKLLKEKEKLTEELEDSVFNVLTDAAKPQKQPDGKYGLLKAADDLASGKFYGEGSTKRLLYLFAMVYSMTYSNRSGGSMRRIDPRTDIEVNLFRDYYANNLMRFISDAYRGRLCEYELDPSGQGINFKNFAEMVYLYYISGDGTPQEKIRRSSEMIGRIKEAGFRKEKKEKKKEETDTIFYRNLAGNAEKSIFDLTEPEFEKFLLENYNCDTYAGTYQTKTGPVDQRVGVMQLECGQNTAYQVYQEVLKKLKLPLEDYNYGLWFTDVSAFRKKGYEQICDRRPEIERERFADFMELLLGINSFMGYTVQEEIGAGSEKQEWAQTSKAKIKALYLKSPREMTRTSLIVAFYYRFNEEHEEDAPEQRKNFEELFCCFKREIDGLLQRAYYQPLSGKNIFDVLVVFSSYAYLYF